MTKDLTDMVWDAVGIRATPRLVLLRMVRYANGAGGSIFPSISSLCDAMALTPPTVRAALAELQDIGVLALVAKEDPITHRPREYRIVLERLVGMRGADTPPQNSFPIPSKDLPHPPSNSLGGGGKILEFPPQNSFPSPSKDLPPSPSKNLPHPPKNFDPSPQNSCPIPAKDLPHPRKNLAADLSAAIASAAANTGANEDLETSVISPSAIIAAFDAALVATFGPQHARRRPAEGDEEVAAAWIDRGADLALCERVFLAAQDRRAKLEQDPIGSLSWFDNRMTAQIQARTAPFPDVSADRSGFSLSDPSAPVQQEPKFGRSSPATRTVWRMRLTDWRDKAVWLPAWGAKPNERRCEAPSDLIAEILPQRELL
ncbi:helix-turn-helix domain-containing protein [Azospirillum sp. A26]|uniref:helix-turn-helix domain-containing protein n=1 Tax=Azospirillum sp. A26 TaxID=3160607 RepID=UPI00366FBC36